MILAISVELCRAIPKMLKFGPCFERDSWIKWVVELEGKTLLLRRIVIQSYKLKCPRWPTGALNCVRFTGFENLFNRQIPCPHRKTHFIRTYGECFYCLL